jgi:CubicO group peptidase (beta-lactamase class C family)
VWRSGPPVYSDINFMLLGIAIERLTGRPLIDQPLPRASPSGPIPRLCAATERCTWRGRVIRGEVHDENAFALGGASGHAGLFGTVDGVLDFAASLLDGTALSADRSGSSAPANRRPEPSAGRLPSRNWHGGNACSADTIGHTGFTGTGLWIDFARGLAWSLLTNRVHPSRHKDSGISPCGVKRASG